MTRVVRSTDLRRKAREILDWVRTRGEEVVIQTYGSPQAVIISYEEYQNYKQLRAAAEQRRAAVERLSRIAEEVSRRTARLSATGIGALVDEAIDET